MTLTVTLPIAGGALIVVPDSLTVLTTYVLREQLDWFEDEIKFVRSLLQPGERAIDVGANYGVYALTMAKVVGPAGRIWAFEPASTTAALLAESISANRFENIVLDRRALSAASGTAQLGLASQAENNALVHGAPSASPTETVPVVSLDDCLAQYGWTDIAFVKLDAEGEETNIIHGGRRFLTECSPLILFEIKAGADSHLHLVDEFSQFGLESYRLVPGLNLLVPFDAYAEPDAFQLNLFCCKPDRAATLAARGLLLDSTTINDYARTRSLETYSRTHRSQYAWTSRLMPMPYGTSMAGACGEHASAGLEDALAHYAMSETAGLAPMLRFSALETSYFSLQSLCAEHPEYLLRQLSLARVAADFGARADAVTALDRALTMASDRQLAVHEEPFLSPAKRFDDIPIGASFANWLVAACAERFEQLCAFSSFFGSAPAALARLQLIASLGFGSEEMLRRLSMLETRLSP